MVYNPLAAKVALVAGVRRGLPVWIHILVVVEAVGNVVIPKGFPRGVGRVESRPFGFPCFPYPVISIACVWHMGLSASGRGAEPHFGTVELTQLGLVKEDPVSVVIHLLKADLLIAEHFADKYPAVTPTDIAVVVHAACLKRPRVLEARHATRQHPCAGNIDAAWRLISKTFVRTFVIEYQAKAIKLLLLRRHRLSWGLCSVLFERAMHSLMPPVLLRTSRLDAFMNNAQLHPSQ